VKEEEIQISCHAYSKTVLKYVFGTQFRRPQNSLRKLVKTVLKKEVL
jgi:hypothetical protein